MKRKARVLVVDDEAKWREEASTCLLRVGFDVEMAATINEAIDHVKSKPFHILVLDIRMVDPDESNVEGMRFLETLEEMGLLDAVEIVMLSAYGTKEQMRTAFRRYRVADFQSKDEFSGEEFSKLVKRILDDMRINLDLDIEWQSANTPSDVVVNVAIGEERVKRNSEFQDRVFLEVEDILCRLFYRTNSVLVRPMAAGRSGAAVLRIQPFFPSGAGAPVVVKFGDYRKIDQEYRNYQEFVRPFLGGGRHTAVEDIRRTPLLGGIVYSLLGSSSERFASFGDFYSRATTEDIRMLLDHLFLETCEHWYASRSPVQPLNLSDEYVALLNISIPKLRRAVAERLEKVSGTDSLEFEGTKEKRTFRNPIEAIAGQRLVFPTCTAITHGDLNDSNILLDEEGHVWLIDFLRTGSGHILRDVAELETAVRLQLLTDDTVSLDDRLQMEVTLAQCPMLSQVARLVHEFPSENTALAKTYQTVIHLRTLAARVVSTYGGDAIDEYYVALLYYALNLVRFYDLPKLQREHALLSACILAEQLGLERLSE